MSWVNILGGKFLNTTFSGLTVKANLTCVLKFGLCLGGLYISDIKKR